MTRTQTPPATLTDLLFDKVNVGLCLVAPDGTVVRANAEWLRSTGFTEEQVVSENIIDLFPGTRDMALAMHARARAGHRVEVPRHAQSVNGRETWWEGSVEPVPMEGGTGLLITAREVAPHGAMSATAEVGSAHAVEEMLRAREAQFRTLIEELHSGVALIDDAGKFTVYNRRFLEMFGLSRESDVENVNSQNWAAWQVFDETGRLLPVDDHPVRRAALTRQPVRNQMVAVQLPSGGDLRWMLVSAEPVLAADDTVTQIICTYHDVTERKVAEAELRASEERYRALFAHMSLGFFLAEVICDHAGSVIDYRYLDVNPAFEPLTGLRRGDVIGRTVREVLPSVEPAWIETYGRVALTGEPAYIQDFAAPLGRHYDTVAYSPRRGQFACLFSDVTERKRAEEALRESVDIARHRTAELETVLDTTPAAVFITRDTEAREMSGNQLAFEALRQVRGANLSKTAPLGQFPINFRPMFRGVEIPPEDLPVQRAARGEEVRDAEFDLHFEDGEVRSFFGNATPLRDADGRLSGAVGAFIDVTQMRRAGEALRASEVRLRLALQAARMVAWEYDPATKKVTLSENAGELLAVRSGRVHEDSDQGYALIHPDDVENHRALVTEAIEKAGSYVSEYRQLGDGGVHWTEERGRAVTDASGRTARLVGVTQNISERKEAEEALRSANERLVEADRRKDEFLGMLSHELRNPLAPIRNSTYILQHAPPGSDQAQRALTVIQRQTEHLTRLVDDLLDVTRIVRGKIELRRSRVDLRDVVARAAEDFRVLLHDRGVRFEVGIPDEKISVDADATRITQVVGNLLHNASKFTRRGDSVRLSMSSREGVAEITVRDTGAGIDRELLPRIFDAFVQGERTLARTDGGLGLGLALVKGITELHGGTVQAHSAGKGHGAEFIVRLPLVGCTDTPAPSASRVDRRNRGRRVLVVDDNTDAAESLADLVRMLGHSVEVAFDGPSAIAAAKTMRPDVVLCDVGLPGMDGYEVAQALRAAAVDGMRIVAVSGYAQPEDVKRAIEAGFDAHVAKPPDPGQIERLLA